MTRCIVIIFSILLLIIIGSFIFIPRYLEYHADISENDYEHEVYEYYYNDILNDEEPAMSDTGAYISTSSALSSETLTKIEEAAKNPDADSNAADGTDETGNPSKDGTKDETESTSKDATKDESESTTKDESEDDSESTTKNGTKNKTGNKTVEADTTLGSYTQIVNQDYTLPEDYRPDDLTEPDVRFTFVGSNDKRKLRKKASDALEKLFSAAEQDGCILYGVSGFRSYERQSEIYNRSVSLHGSAHANLYSAKPGTSEHQSGLSIDISSQSANLQLVESFGSTKEGEWVEKNCWKYGYTLRYPKDKTDITGYAYEPWHIRYVGKKLAKYLYDNDLCLEEYYECEGGTS